MISAEEMLDGLRLHKGFVAALMPGHSASDNPCCPLSSAVWKFDLAKSAIASKVRDRLFLYLYSVLFKNLRLRVSMHF